VSESYIQLPPDGTGKKVRAIKRTVDGNEVYEEAYVIIDPSTGEPITPLKEGGNVNVSNMPTDYLKEGGNVNVSNMPIDYAKEGQLPSSLTSKGNFKVSLEEDKINLLKEGGNINISNLPSNYPLPSSQVSDLKNVTVNNMPTDYLKEGGNVNVANLPSNYPLPSSQVSDLKNVNVNNMPTDYAKENQLPSSLTSGGNFKVALNEDNVNLLKEGGNVNVSNMPTDYLKEGGSVNVSNFPSEYPLPSSQISNLKNVNVNNFPTDYPDNVTHSKLDNIYSKLNSQLDVTLTVLSRLIRYGRNISPSWIHGDEVAAPSANTSLVSHMVSSGKQGLIYGFYVSSDEENVFKIIWVSGGVTRSIRIVFGGGGSIHYVDFFALNEGYPADAGTEIKIVNVNAGGSGKIYQARLFIAEV